MFAVWSVCPDTYGKYGILCQRCLITSTIFRRLNTLTEEATLSNLLDVLPKSGLLQKERVCVLFLD